jgi:hypothetical protein
MAEIGRVIEQIRPSNWIASWRVGLWRWKPTLVTHAKKELLETLVNSLRSDLEANLLASGGNWSFEYQILWAPEDPRVLGIVTRLFSERSPGSIFYGRWIRQKRDRSYILWSDD